MRATSAAHAPSPDIHDVLRLQRATVRAKLTRLGVLNREHFRRHSMADVDGEHELEMLQRAATHDGRLNA